MWTTVKHSLEKSSNSYYNHPISMDRVSPKNKSQTTWNQLILMVSDSPPRWLGRDTNSPFTGSGDVSLDEFVSFMNTVVAQGAYSLKSIFRTIGKHHSKFECVCFICWLSKIRMATGQWRRVNSNKRRRTTKSWTRVWSRSWSRASEPMRTRRSPMNVCSSCCLVIQ